MKILKKSLAIFLTLALCLSAMLGCLSVSAEGTDPAIEIAFDLEEGKVAPGEQFDVAIKATNFAAVKGARFDVNFGTLKVIQVVSSDFSAIVPDNEDGAEPTINVVDDHNVRYVDTFSEIEGGALLVVKVEATELGDATVTVSNVEIGLSSSEMLTPAEIKATVVVEEVHVCNMQVNKDETGHWTECTCGVKTDVVPHTFGEYTDNGDGTETATCECGWTDTRDIEVVEVANATLNLYLDGALSEAIDYDSIATALADAAVYANTSVGGSWYDPVLVLNKDVTLTENIEVGAYTTFNLGDYTVDTAGYAFNITSTGVVKANYQVADFSANIFYTETASAGVYTYSAKIQLTVSSVSLILSNTIFVQYGAAIEANTYAGDIEYGIAYTKGDDTTVYEISESSEDSTIVVSKSKVTADTYGIRSYEMNDDIVAHFYAKATVDGVDYYVYSNSLTYSVVEYAKTILAGNDAVAKDLMKAMLNYGAASQTRFGINPDNLANAILPEADRVIPADLGADVLVPALTQPDMNYTSTAYVPNVALELEEAINIWFTPEDLQSNCEYELLVWDAAEFAALATEGADLEAVLVAENCNTILTLNENNIFVLEGIEAKKFADTYYVRLVEKTATGTNYDSVVAYSAVQFCITSIEKNTADADLCRTIALYSAAARAYFDNYVVNSCR